MAEESAVKVCVRVRPLIEREVNAELENAEPAQLFWKADKKSIHQIDEGNSTKSFAFDRVFTADETTNQLYQDIAKPLIVSTVEGYNGTVFAYGQTSSGKTFTMMGSDRNHGVIPLAVEDVFQTIQSCPKKEFLLRVSYMEIYNETVSDLLVDSWKRKPLEVRETINKNIFVSDLTEELVTSSSQALAWIRKGEKNRRYGKTKMNERSSRSHTIFRMILESRESSENAEGAILVSHLNLVDLAGSERTSQTGADGTRFKEGCNINRSLFTLSQVIKKLTDESQKGFTNYRDSKLTRILQNSLGGNAKTVIICTITPVALDETLSTLQFASTAKKMKNDPRVTEVSDDGALLKRYRNEIVDLKRRLTEVSSVTQTTATEKKVLSQLIQEKDQLQREQQDRIRNLTKLLVTSSNLVPVRKLPKRRVTWGGKMIRLGRPSACGGPSDLSFADSFTRKRKADGSILSDLCEDDEDFDSQWEIPGEPSDDMDMSQSSVTVRSVGNSPKDFVSPDYINKLSGKVSHLEHQLDIESLHKEEAMTRAEASDGRVAELELQLDIESQHKEEAMTKAEASDGRVAELELQLDIESLHKEEAMTRAEASDGRVAELELQLQTEAHQKREALEKMQRAAELELQLQTEAREANENLEMLTAERDYLKQEIGMFVEETERLENENAVLSEEMAEKKEMDEFRSLEEDVRKGHENDMQNEICELKRAVESSELQRLELQNKLETLSEELQKKTEFVKELQSLSGKDLVQEVATLRRSLSDAEGLSRDTKKEWAHLRSKNIAVEEMNVTLSASAKKMEVEVNGLRGKLETEKSRNRALQSDLQKELNVAFDENTKLTALLDGKVPKNLIDGVELERTVARLNRELAASHEAEGALGARLEQLASFQTLPDKVDDLTEQLNELTGEKDALLSERSSSAEEAEQLLSTVASLTAERDQLTRNLQENVEMAAETQLLLQSLQEQSRNNSDLEKLAEQKESEFGEHMLGLSQELQRVREEKDALLSERSSSAEEAEQLLSTVASLTAERDQLQTDMQDNVDMMIENQQELRTALDKAREQKERIAQLETAHASRREDPPSAPMEELHTLIQSLTEELESVRAQRDGLSSERTAGEETERLQSRVASLSEERDQLQETLEALRQEKRQLRAELEDQMETVALAQSGFNQPEKLTSEPQPHDEDVTRLQQEIDELQAALQAVTEQKSQLEVDLQRNVQTAVETQVLQALQAELQEQKQLYSDHMTLCEQKESDLDQQIQSLTEELESVRAQRDGLSSERTAGEETERLQSRVASLSEERDQLQETLEALRQEKRQLRAELEDQMETVALAQSGFNQPEKLTSEPQPHDEDVTRLQQEIDELQAALQAVTEQKSQLEVDLQRNVQTAVETQVLQALQAELQEQKQLYSDHMTLCEQKESDLDQQTETLTEQLESARAERDAMLAKESVCQTSREETERLQSRVASLSEERDQLQETLEALRQEKRQLRAELEDQMETVALAQSGFNQPEKLTSEPQPHDEDVTRLQQEIDELQAALQAVTEQKSQLEVDLQRNVQTAVETQVLQALQAELQEQKQLYSDHMTLCEQKESDLDQQTETLTEQLESARAERDAMLAKESVCQTSREETERLQSRVASLSEERDQLQETLEALRQEKRQLRAELEDQMETVQTEVTRLEEDLQRSVNTASSTQELVKSLREELCGQKQENSDLERLLQEKEGSLDRQMSTLTEKLQLVEAQRDALLAGCRTSREETERLQSRAASLSEERDQLQETLEALRQEKRQLRAELEDQMETVQQLEEQLQLNKRRRSRPQAEADASQQLLGDATATVSVLIDQASSSDQSASGVEETASSRLQDSTGQLQESLRRFQTFIDICAEQNAKALDGVEDDLSFLPKPTSDAFSAVCQLERQMSQTLGNFTERLQARAQGYRTLFEQLAKKDLAVFEQRRLQDVLLCRAQGTDQDARALRDGRLAELLAKRQLQLQKMSSVLEALRDTMVSYADKLSAELGVKERFKEQLTAVFSRQYSNSKLLVILTSELDHRAAMARTTKMTLQAAMDQHDGPCEELKQLEAQAAARLREESSETSSLLQALEEAPLKTDRQQLALQLQQTKETIKALHVHIERLEEARLKACSRVSDHKEATQLLQTELQDSRARVQEKDHAIQSLTGKLRQSEKNASPSAVELEDLRTKLFTVELELSSVSGEHKRDIQKMSSLLSEKEECVRKLKETLRKTQQEGEDSFLQGKDLHARLTNPRGSVIKTSVQLENAKLEEEVTRLQLKISELESSLSSSQDDIGKWKRKAVMLRVKSKAELATPTKRGLSVASDASHFLSSPKKLAVAPRKLPDSPTVSLPDSPTSRFSDLLSRSYPKQFFDNSKLGLVPEAAPAERKEDWWPTSPKQEEMCKTQ